MNGVIIVNKPQNITSFGVCGKLRKITGTKKTGHTGTLDPMAEGVLVVCVGNATRLIDYIKPQSKKYIAEIEFGKTSDTQDIWGEILTKQIPEFPSEAFYEELSHFEGELDQLTPAYSARKVNGRALYSYARNGEDVVRPEKRVTVEKIKVLEADLPFKAKLEIECSKGTYIRTICADLGEKLGCGAVMSSLVRISTDGFPIECAHTLDEIEKAFAEGRRDSVILDPGVLIEYLPQIMLKDPKHEKLVICGGSVTSDEFAEYEGLRVRACSNGRLIALGKVENSVFKPGKVFV